jgi:hypothetical protein
MLPVKIAVFDFAWKFPLVGRSLPVCFTRQLRGVIAVESPPATDAPGYSASTPITATRTVLRISMPLLLRDENHFYNHRFNRPDNIAFDSKDECTLDSSKVGSSSELGHLRRPVPAKRTVTNLHVVRSLYLAGDALNGDDRRVRVAPGSARSA